MSISLLLFVRRISIKSKMPAQNWTHLFTLIYKKWNFLLSTNIRFMIFSLWFIWKQMTLVPSLKILLFQLRRGRKKKNPKPNPPKNLKGANSASEFSKISFSISFSCFHSSFFVFCRDVILTSRIWKLGHCAFYYPKRFLLFNSIRPFIDKGK